MTKAKCYYYNRPILFIATFETCPLILLKLQ